MPRRVSVIVWGALALAVVGTVGCSETILKPYEGVELVGAEEPFVFTSDEIRSEAASAVDLLGGSGSSPAVLYSGSPGRLPPAGLEYRVLMGVEVDRMIEAQVTVTNQGPTPLYLSWGPCAFGLTLFSDPNRTQLKRGWSAESAGRGTGWCDGILYGVTQGPDTFGFSYGETLAPGESSHGPRVYSFFDVSGFGDRIAAGTYYLGLGLSLSLDGGSGDTYLFPVGQLAIR